MSDGWRKGLHKVGFGTPGTRGRRELIGASFRGVSFFVESAEQSGGRRAVVHQFPLRDDPYVEDLGRSARTFQIDGYVIGDDYLAQKNALIEKLEAGEGELVHPYRGVLKAICTSFSVRETKTDGGMATFAIQFAQQPTNAVLFAIPDGPANVQSSADLANVATAAELVQKYDVSGLPAFALASAEIALVSAVNALQSGLAGVVTATQEAAELAGRVAILTAQASSLVRQPAAILGAFRAALTGLVETIAAAPGAVMRALFDAYDAYIADLGPAVVATTATRVRELANQRALVGALRRVIAIEAARLAPLVPYESLEAATAARDQVAALLEEQAATAGDTAYPALVNLRSEVLRAVPGGQAFARIVTVTRNVPIPSLLLAYQLYGSVDLEPDILARNNIRHPGFIAGDVKVLSDDD